jgi:hypothetical protein
MAAQIARSSPAMTDEKSPAEFPRGFFLLKGTPKIRRHVAAKAAQ